MSEPKADQAQQSKPADNATPDVEQVLNQAEASLDELQSYVADEEFSAADQNNSIDLLGDVELDVTIELGRTEMVVEDVLRLGAGSVVELDKLAGDPVDVFVNGRLIARGEVLVLNDNFCIRISEIVADLEEEAQAAAKREQTAAASH